MKLEVFDKETRNRVGMVKSYTYASYTDELCGAGSFTIRMSDTDDSFQYLVYGNYILFEEGVMGVIKGMRDAQDSDREVEVYGYLLNHILSYRVFMLTTKYYDTLPAVFRQMVSDLFINPADPKRRIPYVTLPEGDEWFPAIGKKQTVQNTGDDLLTVLAELALPNDIGFMLYPVIEDVLDVTSPNFSRMEFRVFKAADRTLGNETGNDPVVFSFDLNNLESLEYEDDGRAYASMALVASEGVGVDRKTLEVGDLSREGIDRVEVYVDARDLQAESGSSGGDGEGSGGSGSGSGTGSSDGIWKPTVSASGDISWELSSSTTKPVTTNIKGPKGDSGEDGFSPIIRPNALNTQDEYRLDISTKDDVFTTPNLKGQKGDVGPQGPIGPQGPAGDVGEALGGLTFSQDDEGNWGYIPPGADTVIPFKKGGESGGGSSVEVKNWPNPAMFHPALTLLGVSVVEVKADVIVGSAWKKVDA